ncbi:MAG: sigma 54-dependent Fis family transcriptional regulator [Deltaproteobacteria bacterium]|nr:sigma 54-dependent Fis family transcriptional regulator [Deltaproteobacteria bacterium]
MLVTRVTNAFSSRTPVRAATLRVVDGPDRGMEIDLPPVGVVIGSERTCDVVLTDSFVSRRHCSIAPHQHGFAITDLGSKNGTVIDGVAVGKVVAPPGVAIRIGKTLVQCMPADEVVDIPPSTSEQFGALYGTSIAMRTVFAILERASKTPASMLLLGESGTGKELMARAVHDNSPRKDGPFVVFDCGASTETLIESDLFGHTKGAFTGAAADRQGAFAAANGGTLFLDEIGDLPVTLQPKLLRMLEAGEVIPLGGRKSERYDVRIVAATHRDVFGEVARGGFRGDLYYRLAVVEVHVPPLRARSGDLPKLIGMFLDRAGASHLASQVGGAALERLQRYHWPGNVRELRNVITRAVALAGPDDDFQSMPFVLRPTVAAPEAETIRADRPFHEAKDELVAKFEREYLSDLVQRANGNLSEAARIAGLERKFLYKLLERAGLRTKATDADKDTP